MKDITDSEFLVGQYRVDMLRSQVVAQDNIVAMQPKVLQVLLLLAKNQGEVVSHETILSTIWPDTQVEPNALQRCIAQLRKVFGDDAKQQKFIATHPKIGYSLVVPVNWPQPDLANEAQSTQPAKRTLSLAGIAITAAFFMIALLFLLPDNAPNDLPLNRMKQLTATDNKEFSPAVSPNGNNLVFLRYMGGCKSQLWGMEVKTGKEFLLTKEAGIYGEPTWSPDGNEILYTSAQNCDSERESSGCRSLVSLPFSLSKASPQNGRVLLQCENQNYFSPQWISTNQLALLVADDDSVQVALATPQTDIGDKAELQVIELPASKPYGLVYAQSQNKLIALQKHKQQNISLFIHNLANNETEEVIVQIPNNHRGTLSQNATWHADNETLLIGSKGAILEIGLSGEVVEHTIANNNEIDGLTLIGDSDQIIASIGQADTDVGELIWSDNTASQNQIFGRSNLEEHNAQYQPGGEQIAFLSNKTDSQQIWLKDNNEQVQQLTYTSEIPAGVSTFVWTDDGNALILVSQNQLYIKSLTAQIQSLQSTLKVAEIYQNLGNNSLLLGISRDDQSQIVKLNLYNNELVELYSGAVRWAQVTDDSRLYITENNAKFAEVVDKQALPLPVPTNLLAWHKFFYRDQHLIFLDDNRKLSRLAPDTQTHNYLVEQPLNIHRISDINVERNRLLFSQSISGKREIVLFYR